MSRTMFIAGLLQIGALFTPAVGVRLAGTRSFLQLPNAGVALLVLGVATIVVALVRAGWWRWVPGILSGAIVAVARWRIVHAPSGWFVDPLLRRAVHPAWGFVPMSAAVVISVLGAARSRIDVRFNDPRQPEATPP